MAKSAASACVLLPFAARNSKIALSRVNPNFVISAISVSLKLSVAKIDKLVVADDVPASPDVLPPESDAASFLATKIKFSELELRGDELMMTRSEITLL